jgi:hypothetical protein
MTAPKPSNDNLPPCYDPMKTVEGLYHSPLEDMINTLSRYDLSNTEIEAMLRHIPQEEGSSQLLSHL